MTEDEKGKDDARQDVGDDAEGDVETAGETTAAAAIKGPTDTRPVEPDTTVEPSAQHPPAQRRED